MEKEGFSEIKAKKPIPSVGNSEFSLFDSSLEKNLNNVRNRCFKA